MSFLNRCDRRRIPLITDLEYDVFIREHVAKTQMVVISVTSSSWVLTKKQKIYTAPYTGVLGFGGSFSPTDLQETLVSFKVDKVSIVSNRFGLHPGICIDSVNWHVMAATSKVFIKYIMFFPFS